MLRRIPAETIELGMELPGNVCDQSGTVLLPAGTTISEQHLSSLSGRRFRGVYVGADWPSEDLPEQPEQRVLGGGGGPTLTIGKKKKPPEESKPELIKVPEPAPAKRAAGLEGELVPVDQLRVGTTLRQNLYDPHGKLLLAAGHDVSARFLFLLRQRGAHAVRMHADDLARATKASRPLRGLIDTKQRLTVADLRNETARGIERHAESAHELQDMCQSLARGRAIRTDKVKSVINDFADMVDLDHDLISMVVATQRTLGEYLFDHSINVAMLSVATLQSMGMDRQQVQQIGLGAAFQDIGMLRVARDLRLANRKLDPREWQEVRRHPTFTCDQLEHARGVSPLAANISFQVHERTDGSGYPRGRLSASIHPGARVVAIADAYAAMTRPRPYRAAHLPHHAMQELLRECRRNRFDKTALKAFLDIMSMYPVGSFVALNTGQVCQVIRANAGAPTQPVVAVLDTNGNMSDTTIDLQYTLEIGIQQAIAPAQIPRER